MGHSKSFGTLLLLVEACGEIVVAAEDCEVSSTPFSANTLFNRLTASSPAEPDLLLPSLLLQDMTAVSAILSAALSLGRR